jgi:hypothetical protein
MIVLYFLGGVVAVAVMLHCATAPIANLLDVLSSWRS